MEGRMDMTLLPCYGWLKDGVCYHDKNSMMDEALSSLLNFAQDMMKAGDVRMQTE